MVDPSTRWAEAIPLRSTTADSCAAALVEGWVARFGTPQQITSDRGAQFTSSVWSSFTSLLGIKSKLTTPYYPQANGAVERFHHRLKDSLRARLAGSDWPAHLPWVMLGLRAAPREDSGISAAELVYGCPLSLLGQFLTSSEQPPVSFLRQQLIAPLCGGQLAHGLYATSEYSDAAGGGIRLQLGTPGVAGSGASIPRSLPRPGAR